MGRNRVRKNFFRITASICGLIVFLLIGSGCISVQGLPGIIKPKTNELDEKTIVAGLKEALEIGTQNAVRVVSQKNGYLANGKIRIPLPDDLNDFAEKLRKIGFGKDVDRFIDDMNHAAEKAATGAADIFVDAVKRMTLQDAINILHGADDAATHFFETQTRKKLYDMFFPVIKDSMDSIGVTKLYKKLLDAYNAIPFIRKKSYDLDKYITNKGLDGLFYMLSEEEKKIRHNPAARVTELLRRVFG
jgi:hypothetical protein